MKFKEKLKQENPDRVDDKYMGGCLNCPHTYGYESEENSFKNCGENGGKGCTYCWDREIPGTEPTDKVNTCIMCGEPISEGFQLCSRCEICFTPNDIRKKFEAEDPIQPTYYNDTKIAPIDVIEDWKLGFNLGSTLKYIKRAGKKKGNSAIQDLKKVVWYVNREIKNLEEVTK